MSEKKPQYKAAYCRKLVINARNLLLMLGICFFIQGGEYTEESVWEGEKGVAGEKGRFSVKAKTLKI